MIQRKVKPNLKLLPDVADMLREGCEVILKVKGASMFPFIVGDRDSVTLKKQDTVTVGDIVLMQTDEHGFVIHRVVKIDDDGLTLMGDGNLRGYERCRHDQVIATAISIIKPNKRVNPNAVWHRFVAIMWRWLLPYRNYLLAICRRFIVFKLNRKKTV